MSDNEELNPQETENLTPEVDDIDVDIEVSDSDDFGASDPLDTDDEEVITEPVSKEEFYQKDVAEEEFGEKDPETTIFSNDALDDEPKRAAHTIFRSMDEPEDDEDESGHEMEMIYDIPVKVDVELGRTEMTIEELLAMRPGSIITLQGLAGDPMRVMVNGHPVAKGEIVVADGKYGIRVTETISPSERVKKINQ